LEDKGYRSPLFSLLYIAALDAGAKDWWNNLALAGAPVGRGHKIEYHHVFPQAKARSRYPAALRDSIANLAFLSALGNKKVAAKDPAVYLAATDPAELEKQWIPRDSSLWALDRLPEFCAARRQLLASQLNIMLGLPQASEADALAAPLDDAEPDAAELDEGSAAATTEGGDDWEE
jgi:hypothetical protein